MRVKSEALGEGHRQWNEELQDLMKHGVTNLNKEDITKLSRLGHDFVRCAEYYARYLPSSPPPQKQCICLTHFSILRIIINELCVANEYKTIKPANVGG